MTAQEQRDRELLGEAACAVSDQLVADAPALSAEQRDQLAVLLRSSDPAPVSTTAPAAA